MRSIHSLPKPASTTATILIMRQASALALHAVTAAAAMAPLPWGKRPCQDYLETLRQQWPARLDDDLVEIYRAGVASYHPGEG